MVDVSPPFTSSLLLSVFWISQPLLSLSASAYRFIFSFCHPVRPVSNLSPLVLCISLSWCLRRLPLQSLQLRWCPLWKQPPSLHHLHRPCHPHPQRGQGASGTPDHPPSSKQSTVVLIYSTVNPVGHDLDAGHEDFPDLVLKVRGKLFFFLSLSLTEKLLSSSRSLYQVPARILQRFCNWPYLKSPL